MEITVNTKTQADINNKKKEIQELLDQFVQSETIQNCPQRSE